MDLGSSFGYQYKTLNYDIQPNNISGLAIY